MSITEHCPLFSHSQELSIFYWETLSFRKHMILTVIKIAISVQLIIQVANHLHAAWWHRRTLTVLNWNTPQRTMNYPPRRDRTEYGPSPREFTTSHGSVAFGTLFPMRIPTPASSAITAIWDKWFKSSCGGTWSRGTGIDSCVNTIGKGTNTDSLRPQTSKLDTAKH